MSSKSMGLDDFLGHKVTMGGSQFLRGWKNSESQSVDIWLNARAPIIAIWQHQWPKIVEREDEDGEKSLEVWGGTFNCWETEEVLRRQYKRDPDTGNRQVPPIVCPLCLLVEEIRSLIEDGSLDWKEPLFRFVGTDRSKKRILHAGGLYNAYGHKDVTKKQKKELKKVGISLKESWQENVMTRCNYLFRVIDNDNVSDGIQISMETTLLGDKVKAIIKDAMTALGQEEGNPLSNPYCIRWQYLPKAKKFDEKYKAIKMDKIPLTKEIEDLIYSDSPPDVSNLIGPGNIKDLRSSMEAHYIGPEDLIDFDFIFSKAEALQSEKNDEPFYEDADAEDEELLPKTKKKKKSKKKKKVKPKPEPEPEEEEDEDEEDEEDDAEDDENMVACDECEEPMGADEMVCPHCGFDYNEDEEDEDEEDEDEEDEPPPPPKRRRPVKSKKSKASKNKRSSKTKSHKVTSAKSGKKFKPPF